MVVGAGAGAGAGKRCCCGGGGDDFDLVKVRVKVVLGLPAGEVAAEAKRNGANWVILDKKLKEEQKHCIEKLTCSIVVMKGSQPQVLGLNLGYSDEPHTPFYSATSSPALDSGRLQSFRMKHFTPLSNPEYASSSFSRTTGETSLSTFDMPPSPFLVYEQNPLFEGQNSRIETPTCSPLNTLQSDRKRLISSFRESIGHLMPTNYWYSHESRSPASRLVVDNLFKREHDARNDMLKIEGVH